LNYHSAEAIRYVANGVVATAVHFGVLSFNLAVLNFSSAGLANLIAAIFGIATSFLGNRYFVFRRYDENILRQVIKFSGLYASIAVLHGVLLLTWTDWLGMDYRVGFLIATAFQVSLSYLGNKALVFKT
jgi:putative flippase GtrA